MEDIVGVPMSESFKNRIKSASRLTPRERVKQRTAEHSVDVLMSQILEEIVEEVRFPVEATRLQANDMVVDVPVPMVQTVLKYSGEAPWLQFNDVVGDIPVVAQKQISIQDQFREKSNEIQGITSGNDEFLISGK